MISAVQAVEFLGREVSVQDDQLRLNGAQVMAVRVHPDSPADYMLDMGSGHSFTGSTLVVLEQYVPTEDDDEEFVQ